MKVFYFLFASLLFTTALAAQYEKGNWYLDGNSSALLSVPVGNIPGETNFEAQAFRAGYFFTDRLLVGSRIGMSAFSGNNFSNDNLNLEFRPFARYYFPGGDKRKISYFGELGFGTISLLSPNGSFDTDFHFGGGAEVELLPGVVGTAVLRYEANAFGLNITNLTFGLNLLLGQLEKFEGEAPLQTGTYTTTGSFGGLTFGRRGGSGGSDLLGGVYLNPSLGFFFSDGLMAEGKVSTSYFGLRDFLSFGQGNTESRTFNILNASLEFNLRYYLKKSGTFLPYVSGGLGYELYRSKTTGGTFGDRELRRNTLFYQAGAGMSWFLSQNVALDGSVSYRSNRLEVINSFGSTVRQNAIQAEVGLRFFLKR